VCDLVCVTIVFPTRDGGYRCPWLEYGGFRCVIQPTGLPRPDRTLSVVKPVDSRPAAPLWSATMNKALILVVGRRVGKAV